MEVYTFMMGHVRTNIQGKLLSHMVQELMSMSVDRKLLLYSNTGRSVLYVLGMGISVSPSLKTTENVVNSLYQRGNIFGTTELRESLMTKKLY